MTRHAAKTRWIGGVVLLFGLVGALFGYREYRLSTAPDPARDLPRR